MASTDLPEAAARRLASRSFSSGLSVSEFAACLHMGMRPVGLVQGFCAMAWHPQWFMPAQTNYGNNWQGWGSSWSGFGDVLQSYHCPHGMVMQSAEHRTRGFNIEATAFESAWSQGYSSAYQRLLEEARTLGAHGVIGVSDATKSLIGPEVREFHLLGTAVVMDRAAPPSRVWSTYLAGSKLAKLFEAGLEPVSVVGALAAVSILPVCSTEMQERGQWDAMRVVPPAGEITQLSDAETSVREIVRHKLKSVLAGGALHGARLDVREDRYGGSTVLEAMLRGTKVQRVRQAEPLPAPVPTVRLS